MRGRHESRCTGGYSSEIWLAVCAPSPADGSVGKAEKRKETLAVQWEVVFAGLS